MTAEERRDRIAELTRQGMSARQIADILSITTRTVCRARRAAGCSQPEPIPLTQDELRAAKAFLDDGANYAEVARTLGRNYNAFRRRLPGYAWSRAQVAESAALGRLMAQLERTNRA